MVGNELAVPSPRKTGFLGCDYVDACRYPQQHRPEHPNGVGISGKKKADQTIPNSQKNGQLLMADHS